MQHTQTTALSIKLTGDTTTLLRAKTTYPDGATGVAFVAKDFKSILHEFDAVEFYLNDEFLPTVRLFRGDTLLFEVTLPHIMDKGCTLRMGNMSGYWLNDLDDVHVDECHVKV